MSYEAIKASTQISKAGVEIMCSRIRFPERAMCAAVRAKPKLQCTPQKVGEAESGEHLSRKATSRSRASPLCAVGKATEAGLLSLLELLSHHHVLWVLDMNCGI
jgi:hypothetical protein